MQTQSQTIRETVGVYADPESLGQAADRLAQAGFPSERVTLLTTENSVETHLDHLFERGRDDKEHAFKPRGEGDDATHGLGRGLAFTGQTAAAGAVVATAAAIGGPVAVGLAGAAAVGAVGATMMAIINQDAASDLQQHLDQGHLLLCARVDDDREEQAARDALQANSLALHELEISRKD